MKIQIQKLVLSNFGPLAGEHEINFVGHGTFAVCAPNGAGKSHVICGLKSLVAPGSQFEKPLGAYVYGYGLLGVKAAKIEGTFLVDGKPLVIKRTINLKPAKDEELQSALDSGNVPAAASKLSVSFDGRDIKATADAIEYIESIFDIRNAVQEDAVFVLQGHAGDVLRCTPAIRAKSLQFLCGADVCQRAVEVAQQRMSLLNVVDRSQDIEDKRESIHKLDAEIGAIQTEQALVKANVLTPEAMDALHDKMEKHGTAFDRQDRQEKANNMISHLKPKVDMANAEITKVGMQVAVIDEKWTEEKKKLVQNGRATLMNAKNAIALRDQFKRLQDAVTLLERDKASRQPPDPIKFDPNEFKGMCDVLPTLDAEMNQNRKVISAFTSSEVCPTCGCKPADRQKIVAEAQKKLDELMPDFEFFGKEVDRIGKELTEYDRQRIGYDKWLAGIDSQLEGYRKQLESFNGGVVVPEVAEIESFVSEFDEASVERGKLTDLGHTYERTRDQWTGELTSWTEIASSKTALNGLLTKEEVTALEEQIGAAQSAEKSMARLTGRLEGIQEAFEAATVELKRLLDAQSAVASKLQQIEFLEGLKTCLHHTAVPHDRAAAYIGHINALMEEYCAIMHAPFTVFLHPEHHSFMVIKDGQMSPAYQLSGGQYTLASWAWHLALYQKHGTQVGFIVMDEPTVGLDEVNLSNVAETVDNLGKYCHGSGLQFIMVTHERDMARVFDSVVELAPAG